MITSLPQLAAIWVARRRVIFTVWLAVAALFLGAWLLLPPRYTADASVLVDLRSADPTRDNPIAGAMLASYLSTQADIIRSERVLVTALRSIDFDPEGEWREAWQADTGGRGDFDVWLATQIAPGVGVRPSRDSSVINVTYTSKDPVIASALVNALVDAYVSTTLDLRTGPAREFGKLFEQRSVELRASLEAAQKKLFDYQREKGLITTDERLDIETARLNELTSQLVALQEEVARAEGREREAERDAGGTAVSLNSLAVGELTSELAREQARLGELRARLGENHPSVRTASSRVREVRAELARATRLASSNARSEASVAKSRLAAVRQSLAAQRETVMRSKSERDAATVLQRDVENLQSAYDSVASKATQAQLEAGIRQTNVVSLKGAAEPLRPAFPRLIHVLAGGLVGGLLAGLMAALGLELLNRRTYAVADLVPIFPGLPVVAIPTRATPLVAGDLKRLLPWPAASTGGAHVGR